jgi:ferritin-like metal-binding protein YciE
MSSEAAALRPKLVEQLQTLHAVKSAGLRMFGVLLPAVRRQRDDGSLPEVQDLLERMANAFGRHEQETREHERRLRERLAALGAAPSRPRELGLGAAAVARGRLGGIGGQNHGANARDAFVFEHLEIAGWELLEQLAVRAGDERTAALARECRAQDDEMAALIRRNFPNVLTLMLASQGLPTLRPPEDT